MYNFKYQYLYQSGSTSESKYGHKTILTAIFSFNEVSRNEITQVRERCSINSRSEKTFPGHYKTKEGPLDEFLKETLQYQPNASYLLGGKEYFGSREVVRIIPFLWGLGFKLKSEAQCQLPINEMINLRAINEFIRTGKIFPRN